MSLITCPECESVFTEQQLKDAGMCPSCGLPESVIRRHMPPPEPKSEPAKTSDAPYKTTASKLLAAFAWLIWAGGALGIIVIAIAASQLRYSFYGNNSAGTVLFFAALAVASSSLFFWRVALRRVEIAGGYPRNPPEPGTAQRKKGGLKTWP